MKKPVIYSPPSGTCVQCTATKRKFEALGIPYESASTEDPRCAALAEANGYRQAPVVDTVQGHWSGFRPDLIARLVSE